MVQDLRQLHHQILLIMEIVILFFEYESVKDNQNRLKMFILRLELFKQN